MATKKTKKPKVVKNAKPTPKKHGRPSMYSEALADKICLAIQSTSKGLNSICSVNDDFPHPATIYDWLIKYPTFSEKYARARERQAEFMADQIVEIADDSSNDTMTVTSKSGEPIEMENKEWVNRSKLRVDTRKWLMSKLAPKKYGDKIQTEHSGEVTVNQITGMKVE